MVRCLLRLAVLAVAVFLVLPARGQEKPTEPAKEIPKETPKDGSKETAKDGALPGGAKMRLGGPGMQVRFVPHFACSRPNTRPCSAPDLPGSAAVRGRDREALGQG